MFRFLILLASIFVDLQCILFTIRSNGTETPGLVICSIGALILSISIIGMVTSWWEDFDNMFSQSIKRLKLWYQERQQYTARWENVRAIRRAMPKRNFAVPTVCSQCTECLRRGEARNCRAVALADATDYTTGASEYVYAKCSDVNTRGECGFFSFADEKTAELLAEKAQEKPRLVLKQR